MSAYLYGGLAGLVLVLGGLLWFRTHQLDQAHLTIRQLNMDVQRVAEANGAQIGVIDAQGRALAEFKRLADEHTVQMQQAVAEVVRAQVERDKSKARMLELDAQDAARKECKAVLDQDLALTCKDIAANMVERAK